MKDQVAGAIADDWDRLLARSLLDTDEAAVIAESIAEFAERELGASVDELQFFELSVAAVFGLRLDDERRVVVKVFRPDTDKAFLSSVIRVQQQLAESAFPCPPVLGSARPFGRGQAFVMPMLDDGDYVDATDAAVRGEWAALLHRHMRLSRAFAELPGFPAWRPSPDRLWCEPHNVMFDFERSRSGAERIDAVAADALEVLRRQRTPAVPGHADWSAKHFRYASERTRGERVTVVYDWDSLRRGTEAELVASAAMTFSVTWYVPGRDRLPAVEDSLAFVTDYEAARGAPFSRTERRALAAAARYASAYNARCEHSVAPNGENAVPGSARATLEDVVKGFRF